MNNLNVTFIRSTLVLALLSLPLIGAQAPEKAAPQNKSADIKLNTDLVVLDTQVVQQKTGRIEWKLKQSDFTVFEDGVKQQISQFSQDTLPLSVILLVDRRGCLDPISEKLNKAVVETIARFRPEDEVAVMSFSDKVNMILPFSTDKDAVASAMNHLPDHDDAETHCFNLAFYKAAQYMSEAANPNGRRVIIVVTGITKSWNCPGRSSEEVRTAVVESGSTVCGLIPHSAEQASENAVMHGIAGIAHAAGAETLSISNLTEETGGELVEAKTNNIEFLFDNLITRIRTRYAIGFVSSNLKHDGSYRKVKVEIRPAIETRDGKLIVKTRRGYIAPKDK